MYEGPQKKVTIRVERSFHALGWQGPIHGRSCHKPVHYGRRVVRVRAEILRGLMGGG